MQTLTILTGHSTQLRDRASIFFLKVQYARIRHIVGHTNLLRAGFSLRPHTAAQNMLAARSSLSFPLSPSSGYLLQAFQALLQLQPWKLLVHSTLGRYGLGLATGDPSCIALAIPLLQVFLMYKVGVREINSKNLINKKKLVMNSGFLMNHP